MAQSPDSKSLDWLYDQITGDEDARVCKDIPEASCRHLPRNFFSYLAANSVSKVADELSSARLVFPWLLGALGAPAAFVGFLVPIREAGVLLPQLLVAAYIRHIARRKWVWVLGAGLSAAALLTMAFATVALRGNLLGWSILGLLALYSLARGICSVSAKDVLGKTVSKSRRGRLMGLSSALSGTAVVALGAWLNLAGAELTAVGFALLLTGAAALWIIAIVSFAPIVEEAGATSGGGNALTEAVRSLGLLRSDRPLRQFIIARALLLSVALAPPFYVLMAQQHSDSRFGLGILMMVSGAAGFASAPLWGRMADRDSRLVMTVAAVAAGALGLSVFTAHAGGWAWTQSLLFNAFAFATISLCHSGVRLGRKVYLIDMATAETRARYVAVSNTVIGVAMLFGGLIGFIGDWLSASSVVGVLGLIALASAGYLARLGQV